MPPPYALTLPLGPRQLRRRFRLARGGGRHDGAVLGTAGELLDRQARPSKHGRPSAGDAEMPRTRPARRTAPSEAPRSRGRSWGRR